MKITNKITGETTAVVVTKGLHLRLFIKEMLESDDVFLLADGEEGTGNKNSVAELVAYDNYGQYEDPELAAVFVGNLDDADLLAEKLNGMPFSDYFIVRKPAGFCADKE